MKTIMIIEKECEACTQVNLNLKGVWKRWMHNYSSRRQLLQLDRTQLKDIGVTREQALEEARKSFWQK
ncbi:DUF1127 domain-containing protein [uncultured Amphritea sp.]|uniref:DUF1127 domain-containing protein n=1 Tax=uncultured Amphritea sp. TaxID=981605 RepID=UPI0026315421|nr:DUF1127 domain-containing protein [uncultured Amphritea sp.]